jgi:hypothetical protein
MWKCSKCGQESNDQFNTCWQCGTSKDGREMSKEEQITFDTQKVLVALNAEGYESTYKTARGIAVFVSFVGWLLVALGVFAIIKVMFTSGQSSDNPFVSASPLLTVYGVAAGIGSTFSGLMLVLTGQLTRAVIDTADNTGRVAFALLRGRIPRPAKVEASGFGIPAKANNPKPNAAN